MAGLNDPVAASEERWAKAERYARGYADNGMGEALRIYYTRYLPAGVLLVIIVIIIINSVLFPDEPDRWRSTTQAGFFVFAFSALIGGLIYNAKRLRPRVELGSDLSIMFPLEKEEQKAIRRGITGKEPVPDNHLTVARAVAVQSRKSEATILLVIPAYTYFLGQAAGSLDWVYLLLFAALVGMVILQARNFWRQGRFLAATAPDTT